MLKSAPLIPVTPASPIHGWFVPSHAVRAPIPHAPTDVVGSTTSTGKRARTPELESVSSPTPLRRGTSVTLPAASVAVAVSAIARKIVVAANLSSAVRLPYRSRATTRKTTVSRERSVRLPTTGVSPRSTTSASGGPGSTRTSTVRVSVSTLAVMVVAPARSPSGTRTRTTPDVSLSAALGVTVPLLAAIVTGCPTNGAPVVSRTSSTNACGSVEPTVPCSSAPPVNWVRGSDITGRGGAGGGGGAACADVSVTATTGDGAGALGRAGAGARGRGVAARASRARKHWSMAATTASSAPA